MIYKRGDTLTWRNISFSEDMSAKEFIETYHHKLHEDRREDLLWKLYEISNVVDTAIMELENE